MVVVDFPRRYEYLVWGSDDKQDWYLTDRVETLAEALDEADENSKVYSYAMVTGAIIFKNFDLPKE